MYRQCDECNGVFKIPKQIEKYLEERPEKIIYCPYCNNIYSHVAHKEINDHKLRSKRGKIW